MLHAFFVDAFAERVFEGNPAAVVPLETWLPDTVMQAMAAEHNLSETAFLIPDGAGQWHLRWFTPATEVELCGHATLATAHVLATELGVDGPLRFRTLSGMLGVAREGDLYVLDFPARGAVRAEPPAGLAEALGAMPREVWRSRDWLCVFDTAEEVRRLRPDHGRIAALGGGDAAPARVIVTAPGGDGVHDVVSRFFAASVGVPEDPVTGVAHNQLLPFWAERLGRRRLVCRQASRRGGTLWCELRDGPGGQARALLGGKAVLYGRMELPLPG
ncbi:PhzF family phenazine biosynthesis protein [Roseomonas gilardii]|uniref:PhzF family phenazine biosynthesis protein n=1 Tax=Roseomonas gilardii TaxID=257708 RepID=A0ABU3MCK2_9PROT|nr:PhzF family phenazine biosynthesis protein [Roseomonas gilardii]MDT8330636.1 PhzF family phenazine biosynthesis protein [Roseomonas gilardii]